MLHALADHGVEEAQRLMIGAAQRVVVLVAVGLLLHRDRMGTRERRLSVVVRIISSAVVNDRVRLLLLLLLLLEHLVEQHVALTQLNERAIRLDEYGLVVDVVIVVFVSLMSVRCLVVSIFIALVIVVLIVARGGRGDHGGRGERADRRAERTRAVKGRRWRRREARAHARVHAAAAVLRGHVHLERRGRLWHRSAAAARAAALAGGRRQQELPKRTGRRLATLA